MFDLVVKGVRVGVKGSQIELTEGGRTSEGPSAVEHLEVVRADGKRRVAERDEGRLHPEKRRIGLFNGLAQAQHLL